MKRKFRMVAAIGAFALLSSASICASAQNSVAVQKVDILGMDGNIARTYTAVDNITLTPSELMQVTIQLSDEAKAAVKEGEVTFLSYVDGEENALSNDNIQYIDQKTSDDSGSVVIRFRPRTTIGQGEFAARIGGVNVAEAGSFSYTVAEADKTMSLTGSAAITEGSTEAAAFTLDPVPTSDVTVTIDKGKAGSEKVLAATEYSCTPEGTLSILNAGSYAVGEHTVTVSAEGYTDASAKFEVLKKTVDVTDEEKAELEKKLTEITATPVEGNAKSVTLPGVVTAGEKEFAVSYTLKDNANNNVTLDGTTLTLASDVFAAKVVVTAKVGDSITGDNRIYIVPADTKIAFGNIGLFADANGGDAFADDDSFKAVLDNSDNANEFLAEKAIALSLALRKATGDTAGSDLPVFDVLDYDRNGTITLAEYRVFKLMLAGQEGFKPSDIAAQRQ